MKNLPILFVSFIFFVACNKEPHYKTVYLDAGLKIAFNNKPGSYWIYKDSVTGELDSLFLVSNRLTIDGGYASTHGENYEMMYLDYESKHIGPDTSYNLIVSLSFSTREGNLFTLGLDRGMGQPLQFWFTYPFTYLNPVQGSNDTVTYSQMTTSLILGTHQFNDVTTFTQTSKTNLSEGSTGFWTGPMGPVKVRLLRKSPGIPVIKVLELQRWKLIK